MPKNTFSESEIYLLKNWPAACRLEEAMNRVRHEKYAVMINEAAKQLIDRLGKNEYKHEVFATQNWGDGFIYFWMKKWGESDSKSDAKRRVPYFCIGGLRLENLMSDDAPSDNSLLPYACLHAKYLRNAGWALADFRDRLVAEAAETLKDFPKRSDEDEQDPICYYLTGGRTEIRQLLLTDERGFTNLLISHGLRLADLAPSVTKILAGPK